MSDATLIALGFALLATACDSSGAEGPEEFMKMLSYNARSISYIDTAAIYDDSDLRSGRKEVEDTWHFEDLDIDLGDLDYAARSEEDGNDLYLLGGLEDHDGLRDELDDLSYDEDEFRGVEVWVNTSQTWESLAFLPDGGVLVARYEDDMEDVLRRRDRDGASLYDEIGSLWTSLPSGIIQGSYTDCEYTDCYALGWSVDKENTHDFKIVWMFAFDSERDAQRALDEVENDLEGLYDCGDPRVDQEGRTVTGEVFCDLDTLAIYAWL